MMLNRRIWLVMIAGQVVGSQVWMMELRLSRDVANSIKISEIIYFKICINLLVVVNSLRRFDPLPK
jgi:hypothetical protein